MRFLQKRLKLGGSIPSDSSLIGRGIQVLLPIKFLRKIRYGRIKKVQTNGVCVQSLFGGHAVQNTAQAKKYSRFAYEQGAIPMTPHLLYPQFMCDENPAECSDAMHFNYVFLGNCSELWVFGSRVSDGMAHEIGIAKKRKLTIRWFNESCEEVSGNE